MTKQETVAEVLALVRDAELSDVMCDRIQAAHDREVKALREALSELVMSCEEYDVMTKRETAACAAARTALRSPSK